MNDLTKAVYASPTATSEWICKHAVGMSVPGLGMPLTNTSRQWLRQLGKVSWLLGRDANKHMTLLFAKGDRAATFVGFSTAGNADITATLRSLGIEPAAMMPDGQRRYNTDAISVLIGKAEKMEALGK